MAKRSATRSDHRRRTVATKSAPNTPTQSAKPETNDTSESGLTTKYMLGGYSHPTIIAPWPG